ncbi:MAG: glycerol-3-phosphate acyltransferase [Sediminimonas qiaohouensis]|uniref:Glycerol-3-phosphate acyltransferase n=1 Tax=Sediminimonas qiaohouensis TaxID=552061 RepID=A0A7C9LM70_9RHOB|nr:1-acyl-sn-glycerol-3-phosphate acyltransferase [Sediminimonas qiaohouensis]MTJ03800.1 glycerol-3-phosphate acyltransferase [Sediminimonas qiaohouensis]
MGTMVEIPLWALVLIVLFAAVTFASHFLFPSVRWFFRRRMEKVVARLNERLERPIQPFKLARRHDMIQRLIYDPEVSRAIAAHAKARGIPENVAFEHARAYAREIVPSFSASLYFGFAIRVTRLLSRALYDVHLGPHDEAALRRIDRDDTLVFVINHRSNMDYVLVTYLAAERSALSYAVGEWARIWPLSRLIRAMGAYFIRRKSRDELYRRVLARYVRMATDGGVAQAVFPEGGLSLTGEVQQPRLGLFKYIVEGHDTAARDVVFVPVSLNYDRVLEDRILVTAGQTGERRFRARISVVLRFIARSLWLRVRGRYHRFGTASVNFGTPLALSGFKGDVDELAEELMQRIKRNVPALPVPLVAAELLRSGGAMSRAELEADVAQTLASLPQGQCPCDSAADLVAQGMKALKTRGLVSEGEDGVRVVEGEKPLLSFYAASVAHLTGASQAS